MSTLFLHSILSYTDIFLCFSWRISTHQTDLARILPRHAYKGETFTIMVFTLCMLCNIHYPSTVNLRLVEVE